MKKTVQIDNNTDNNIDRLRNLVNELTIRDERLIFEHEFYGKIIKLILDGVWIVNEHNITTFVNDKMAIMLGYLVEEMIGRNIFEFMEEGIKDLASKSISKGKNGITENHFLRLKKKNGDVINTKIAISPVYNNKSYRGSISYIREVSIQEISNFYKQIFFDVIIDGFTIVDFNGVYIDVNEQFANMLGYKKNDIIGKHFINFVHDHDIHPSKNVFDGLLEGNELINFENSLIHKNGYKCKISWKAKSVSEYKLIFATARDIK